MKNCSILLPVTGTRESLHAAELAWYLARQTNCSVLAQHVIDITSTLEFIGVTKPGLIGSGPYVAAYESICRTLRDVANKLDDSYTARVSGLGIDSTFVIDEGDPAREILQRAEDCSLIVIGHSALTRSRQSLLVESLLRNSSIPVLVVPGAVHSLSNLAVFCSMDHVNRNWLSRCLSLTRALSTKFELTFLASGKNEERPIDFLHDLSKAYPELDLDRLNIVLPSCSDTCEDRLVTYNTGANSLVVVPTINDGTNRITSWEGDVSSLLGRVETSPMIFWPEEFSGPVLDSASQGEMAGTR